MLYLEVSEAGIEELKQKGLTSTPQNQAIKVVVINEKKHLKAMCSKRGRMKLQDNRFFTRRKKERLLYYCYQ